MKHIPYTYRIAWSRQNINYYGVRYAKTCRPNDLWKTYFTSSKHVWALREELGEPDVVEVRKIFSDPYEAKSWEIRVLQRLKVLDNDKWLNMNIGGEQFIIKEHSSSTKQKMSLNNFSKRPEGRKVISKRQRGSSNSFYGKHHTDEAKRIKSEKNKGFMWWTNGPTEVKSKMCPLGFTRGRKLRSNFKLSESIPIDVKRPGVGG